MKHLCKTFFQKTTTLIVLSTELHLSKSNECHQLFLLYGIMFSNHELKDVGMAFPPPLLQTWNSIPQHGCLFICQILCT